MITTYDLGDTGSHQALADELSALGFTVGAQRDSDGLLAVTHPIDQAGRLDDLVYAAVPAADIDSTALDGVALQRRVPRGTRRRDGAAIGL